MQEYCYCTCQRCYLLTDTLLYYFQMPICRLCCAAGFSFSPARLCAVHNFTIEWSPVCCVLDLLFLAQSVVEKAESQSCHGRSDVTEVLNGPTVSVHMLALLMPGRLAVLNGRTNFYQVCIGDFVVVCLRLYVILKKYLCIFLFIDFVIIFCCPSKEIGK